MVMTQYRVVDLSADGRQALLLDTEAHRHVVHLRSTGLERGVLLHGRPAKLGEHVLVAARGGPALHVRFESVACSQGDALALMHPLGHRVADAVGAGGPGPSRAPAWTTATAAAAR
jgi:hypothetical protein